MYQTQLIKVSDADKPRSWSIYHNFGFHWQQWIFFFLADLSQIIFYFFLSFRREVPRTDLEFRLAPYHFVSFMAFCIYLFIYLFNASI